MTTRRHAPRPFLGPPCPSPAATAHSPTLTLPGPRSVAPTASPGPIDPDRLTRFLARYERNLRALVPLRALGYAYGLDAVPGVVARMRRAFETNTYSLDGDALRGTCRALGIRPTRQAINAYLQGGPRPDGAT